MSEEEDDCLYDRLIEPNRKRIVKYFDPYVVFDIMRQEGVMTMDDQERIQNMYPPTRLARAGQFLDILQTKGDNGVQKYIDVLEYDYPHVYKLITNRDAKDPPRGFKQHRESLRSKWIDRLGEFVDVITSQCNDNTSLKEQLEDVKAVVILNQENIQASENENNSLREQVRMISEENRAFREQNGNLLRERDRLKDDNLKIQRDCLEYFKEKDHYKDKLNIVQQEKENLEQETRTLTTVINQLKAELTHNNRDSARVEKKVEQIQNKLRQINPACLNMDEIIEMKGTHESEVSWQRRKKFLAVNQSKFPNERLTALSYCYTNVLLYGCKYSKKLMEELYEIACDVANYPWDQPVNKTSMTNKIFDESIVVSTVQNSVKKNGQRNIKKRKSSSMKDFLKAFKDLNLDDNTADSQDAPTNENTILDNSQNENIQASFDNSIYREYICPVIDLQNKSNVVYSKLVRKDSDHTNKTKKLDPKTVATNTVHRKLIYDTFMPDLNLTSQVSTSKSVKPKTTSITCNPDDIHVTNKLNFVGSDNLHITESNTNKKSHSQVETEYVGNANQIEMKDKQTSHCSIKLHPTISIAKKSKRREIQLGSGKTYDCCKSKAKQKYENRKACTKINQKSNEKPETKTAEESLIHLKTDKITRADEVETDHLLFCCALTLLILLYNLFPLYDQYLQYGRDYAPPCSLGNRRSGYRVQLPRGENTE